MCSTSGPPRNGYPNVHHASNGCLLICAHGWPVTATARWAAVILLPPRAGAAPQHASPLTVPAHRQHARDLRVHLARWNPALRMGPAVGAQDLPPYRTELLSDEAVCPPRCTIADMRGMRSLRSMSTPVYEKQRLGRKCTTSEYSARGRNRMPLGLPSGPARDQALQLATNGDILIGRADNGATMSLSALGLACRRQCPEWPCRLAVISSIWICRSELASPAAPGQLRSISAQPGHRPGSASSFLQIPCKPA